MLLKKKKKKKKKKLGKGNFCFSSLSNYKGRKKQNYTYMHTFIMHESSAFFYGNETGYSYQNKISV